MSRGRWFVGAVVVSVLAAVLGIGSRPSVQAAGVGISYTVADTAADEGSAATPGVMTFTVTAQGVFLSSETVHFATADGTAHAGVDYIATSGDLTFTGSGDKTVQVTLIGDSAPGTDKTLSLVLSNNESISDGTATGTIRNDDFTLSIGDLSVTEGNTGFNAQVQVSLSAPRSTGTSVKFQTAPGTATAGDDYTTASGTVSIPANASSTTISIPIIGDTVYEDNETFTVSLNTPSSPVVIDDGTATVTLLNDDPEPSANQLPKLSIADAQTTEENDGTHTATFTVTLDSATSHSVSVTASTTDGTATAPDDYVTKSAPIDFGPATGPQSKQFSVTIKGDTLDEANETFNVNLSAPSAATIADGTATMTIIDDDGSPAVSVNDTSAAEGNKLVFTVSLAFATGRDVSVHVKTSPGTASATDFAALDTTITIGTGTTSKTVEVQTTPDTTDEPNETVILTATTDTSSDTGTGTIIDDDETVAPGQRITTGAGAGAGSHVRVFDGEGTPQPPEGFFPYPDGPGVRVARGDLDGDGHDELIVGPGPGITSLVQVYSPSGSTLLASIDAYPGFTGGVFVAAGDVDGDGKDDVITSPGRGGGPHVRVFKLVGSAGSRSLTGSPGFFAARSDFTGGLTVAAGDLNGDHTDEIILGVASADQPIVYVWNYNPTTNASSQPTNPFLAYIPEFLGGLSVAAGDLDGDGRAEIVTGAGPGGGPHVRVFSGSGGGLPGSAYAYDAAFRGGVLVAVGDVDGDGVNEIITAAGPGGGPHVRTFNVVMQPGTPSFYAYGPFFGGGVFLAAGTP